MPLKACSLDFKCWMTSTHHHPLYFISPRRNLVFSGLRLLFFTKCSSVEWLSTLSHPSLWCRLAQGWPAFAAFLPALNPQSIKGAWKAIGPTFFFTAHIYCIEFELTRSIGLVLAPCLQLNKVLSVGFLSLVQDLIKLDLSCQLTDWATWQSRQQADNFYYWSQLIIKWDNHLFLHVL